MKAIKGNTYPVKEELKALGGHWDGEQKAWMVPDDKEEQAKDLVAHAPVPARAAGCAPVETKRCWECGCEFTYADAKRNDGDWRDGYCGC